MIPGLPQIGGMELIILLSVVLLFFGAKRIPGLARSIGGGVREFRKGASNDYEETERDEPRELSDEAHLEERTRTRGVASSAGPDKG